MRFFPREPKPGDPISKRGVLSGLRAIAHALETLSVHGGRVDWQNGEPKIILGTTAGLEPGRSTGDPDSGGARAVVTVAPATENAPPDGKGDSGVLGLPEQPESGVYMLVSRAGVVQWEEVQEFDCPS